MKKTCTYLFLISASVVFLSGCASSRSGSEGPVEAQMGVLADEVTRLDQALQETRAQLQQEQARVADLESRLGVNSGRSSAADSAPAYASGSSEPYTGVYRTPSGFELPSASVQQALKNAGYYNGTVDGKIGPETRESVRKFQSDNGLTPDGIIGKTTWNRLKTYLNS